MESSLKTQAPDMHDGHSLALTGCRVELGTPDGGESWEISSGKRKFQTRSPREAAGEPGWRATELVMAGLALCMSDLAWAYAHEKGIPLEGLSASVEDQPEDEPIRIGSITIRLELQGPLSEEDILRISKVVAKHCKIKNTLTAGADVVISMNGHDIADTVANDNRAPAEKLANERGIQCAC